MKKILVVDDEEDILFILKNFLSKQGYVVATTLSCDHGLEIFYSFKPDLVLLDVNVGKSDGRVMCRTIKTQAEYAHIPVILISAHRDNLSKYTDCGAAAGLEKPFQLPHVLSAIQSHLAVNQHS